MSEHEVLEPPDTEGERKPRPYRLVRRTELIGEYQGSGYREPKYILRRRDGQVMQLPRLLYQLAGHINGKREPDQLASLLSEDADRAVDPDEVVFLVERKLRPHGIVRPGSERPVRMRTPPPKVPRFRGDALLLLKFRVGLVPTRVVWAIAGVFRRFFWPPVVVAGVLAFVALDVLVAAGGALGQVPEAARALIFAPAEMLLVFALVIVSAMFHEAGHVAACRYGGARPGKMGVGIYLVWPALYSEVTDAYRLSRRGRLRTDLGGVYFNTLFIAGASLAYLNTGAPWLLVAIVALHIETLWQFLPSIRLDGYYILADLVGVPDLFSLLGPVFSSLLPWRPAHPKMLELRPRVRWIVTAWVVIIVPLLLTWFILILVAAPAVLPAVWDSLNQHATEAVAAGRSGQPAEATLGALQSLLVVLPWVGIALLLGLRLNRLARWCGRGVRRLRNWAAGRGRARS